MSRIFHRPMFRTGGSSNSGITSGLRSGYKRGRVVEPGGYSGQFDILETIKKTPEAWDAYKKVLGDYPKSQSRSDFLINFGLDLASRSPSGNIISTAAQSAKEPFKIMQQQTAYDKASERQEKKDFMDTYLTAQATALTGDGARDAFSHEAKQERIANLMREAFKLDGIDTSKLSPEDLQKHQQDRRIIDVQLQDYIDVDPVVKAYYGDKETVSIILEQFRKGLVESPKEIDTDGDGEVDMTESEYYTKNPDALEEKVYELFRKQYQKASSPTRTGAALGGIMEKETETIKTPDATMKMSEEVEEVPETLSYEELRRRLPPEVTDDVVVLLSQSGEALTDFAEIQTQVDVDNFNAKYGVNLVLPSEA